MHIQKKQCEIDAQMLLCKDLYINLLHAVYTHNISDYKNVINMINSVQSIVEKIHDYCIMDVDEYINDKNDIIRYFSQENIKEISKYIHNIETIIYTTLGDIYTKNVENIYITTSIDIIYRELCIYNMLYFINDAHNEWKARKELLIHYNRLQMKNKRDNMLVDDNKHENHQNGILWCNCFKRVNFDEMKKMFCEIKIF